MARRPDVRRKKILGLLAQVPISSTQQLADGTGVSTETMRKDLDALAEEGLIIKVHGGVALANGAVSEIPFDLRATKNAAAKQKIAKAAVTLIQRHDSIVLESCTTNLELARRLSGNPELLETIVVITNSFPIATMLDWGRKCHKFFFLGGRINPNQYSCQGPQAIKMLEDFHVSKAFISGAALTEGLVLTGYYEDDVAFQRTAIRSATETVLMIDSSKFGQAAILSVAALGDLHYLVTNKELLPEELEAISKQGVQVIGA